MQGYDLEGRAIFIGNPTRNVTFDDADHVRDAIYTVERAVACSETKSGQEQSIAILNYAGFNPVKHSPPMHLTKQVLSTLRNHYVGRVHRIYLIDAPWTVRTLWALVKPFAGSETRKKLVFVTGAQEKKRVMGAVLHTSQAPPWILPGGEMTWKEPLDLDRYLRQLPFNKSYNEIDQGETMER